MKLRFLLQIFVVLVVATFSSSAQTATPDLLGTFDGGRYTNKVLKFGITIPDGWLIAETEERKALTKVGSEAIKTGNRQADLLLAEGQNKEIILVFVTEKPLGSINNGAFGMSTTKLPVKGYTPKFLTETFKSTLLANPKNRLVKDVSIETIGGRTWGNVLIDLDFLGQIVHTNYFVTVIGDYALVATMSYQDSRHLNIMDAALRGIKFSEK